MSERIAILTFLGTTLAAGLLLHGLMLGLDRIMLRHRWRYVAIFPIGMIAAATLGVIPPILAGFSPLWTLVPWGVLFTWALIFAMRRVVRLGKEVRKDLYPENRD